MRVRQLVLPFYRRNRKNSKADSKQAICSTLILGLLGAVDLHWVGPVTSDSSEDTYLCVRKTFIRPLIEKKEYFSWLILIRSGQRTLNGPKQQADHSGCIDGKLSAHLVRICEVNYISVLSLHCTGCLVRYYSGSTSALCHAISIKPMCHNGYLYKVAVW